MVDPPLNIIDEAGGEAAAPGPDHRWFPWSAPGTRRPFRWPHDARVAVAVVVDLGAVEWEDPAREPIVRPVGGRGIAAPPDFPRMSHREFGHRVGVFRLLQMLGSLEITPAVAIDVLTVEHYTRLVDHLRPLVGEFLAGGLSASRPITSWMTEDEERHYITTTLDRLDAGLGVRPAGWRGPEHSESARTPALLAKAGLRYVVDWCNDDQPYPMPGAGGDLWSFPLSWELSDVSALHLRGVSPVDYSRSIREALEVMAAEGAVSGRVLGLHLHPWLSGQAFRAAALLDALRALRSQPYVWIATPVEIVEWARRGAAGSDLQG